MQKLFFFLLFLKDGVCMDKLFSYENARQKWSQKRNLKFEMNLGNECVSRLRATDFCVKQKLIHTPADTELDREAFVTVIVASMKHSSFMRSEGFTGPHYLITRIAGILQAFDVFLNVLFHVVPFL